MFAISYSFAGVHVRCSELALHFTRLLFHTFNLLQVSTFIALNLLYTLHACYLILSIFCRCPRCSELALHFTRLLFHTFNLLQVSTFVALNLLYTLHACYFILSIFCRCPRSLLWICFTLYTLAISYFRSFAGVHIRCSEFALHFTRLLFHTFNLLQVSTFVALNLLYTLHACYFILPILGRYPGCSCTFSDVCNFVLAFLGRCPRCSWTCSRK